MIGVDTNVLVRYIVQDDPAQSHAATRYLERHCTAKSPGYICLIVLCELVWVLDSAYHYQRKHIAEVLKGVLDAAEFDIEQADIARRAWMEYDAGVGDFADCLIGQLNTNAGADHTATFDRRAGKHEMFKLIGA